MVHKHAYCCRNSRLGKHFLQLGHRTHQEAGTAHKQKFRHFG